MHTLRKHLNEYTSLQLYKFTAKLLGIPEELLVVGGIMLIFFSSDLENEEFSLVHWIVQNMLDLALHLCAELFNMFKHCVFMSDLTAKCNA